MQRFLRYPPKSCNPAIAKIKKKNSSTIIVSLSSGIEDKRAETITFSPSIEEILFKGLKTLKALNPLMFTLPLYTIKGM